MFGTCYGRTNVLRTARRRGRFFSKALFLCKSGAGTTAPAPMCRYLYLPIQQQQYVSTIVYVAVYVYYYYVCMCMCYTLLCMPVCVWHYTLLLLCMYVCILCVYYVCMYVSVQYTASLLPVPLATIQYVYACTTVDTLLRCVLLCMYTIISVCVYMYYVLLYVCVAHSFSFVRAPIYQLLCSVCVYTTVGGTTVLCIIVCMYTTQGVCMYTLLQVYVLVTVYVLYYVCMYTIHYYVCMYTIHYYVCMYTMHVCNTQRACVRPPPSACAACVGVPVLTQCIHVVSIVEAMGSPCRTYVVCGVVYVSTVSLGCTYCSRCVLLLMIVRTKEQVCMCLCAQQRAYRHTCVCSITTSIMVGVQYN